MTERSLKRILAIAIVGVSGLAGATGLSIAVFRWLALPEVLPGPLDPVGVLAALATSAAAIALTSLAVGLVERSLR